MFLPSLAIYFIYSAHISMVVCRPFAACNQYMRVAFRSILSYAGRLPIHRVSFTVMHPARRALCEASSAIDLEALLSLSEAYLKIILQSILKTSDGIQARLSIIV